MGGVGAFVPEHCGKRPRACIQSDADFGSGAGTAERRPAAVRRLAVTLPLGCERTVYGTSGTAAPVGRAGELARIVRSACGRDDPVHGRGAAGATVAARLHRADDDGEPVRLRCIERPEHAPDFTAWVIRGDREMYCTWLSVRSALPVCGGWGPGVLAGAGARRPSVRGHRRARSRIRLARALRRPRPGTRSRTRAARRTRPAHRRPRGGAPAAAVAGRQRAFGRNPPTEPVMDCRPPARLWAARAFQAALLSPDAWRPGVGRRRPLRGAAVCTGRGHWRGEGASLDAEAEVVRIAWRSRDVGGIPAVERRWR
jgi:hypothetical protein